MMITILRKSLNSFFTVLVLSVVALVGKSVSAESLETKVVTIFDKVPLNASKQDVVDASSLQDGASGTVKMFTARNGFASFNLLLSAQGADLSNLSVTLDPLVNASGGKIENTTRYAKDNLFDFSNKPLELFFVKYLEIKGLSKISYESNYDERHVPKNFRRPWSGQGSGRGGWKDRPHANKLYPDILVPSVLNENFKIQSGNTQSIIGDIFVRKDIPAGVYHGNITISSSGKTLKQIPIELTVKETILGDDSPAKTMVYYEKGDIAERYLGIREPTSPAQLALLKTIIDNHFKVARRHGITLFDKSTGTVPGNLQQPEAEWIPRLSGEIFTKARGYEGPGVGEGTDLFVIGAYGSWDGKDSPEKLRANVQKWDKWFASNFPDTETFFYVADESDNFPQTEGWCSTVEASSKRIRPFITAPLPKAVSSVPSAGVVASWFNFGIKQDWIAAHDRWKSEGKQFALYNGRRPLSGTFATEDDGISPRTLPWIQLKYGASRWFFWNSTYYTNFQGGTGKTNVFKTANTFGAAGTFNETSGDQGWNYSNGDGVLLYPGTEMVFPAESYAVNGPFASLRLKLWRAGIEDAKYLELALRKNNAAASQIIHHMVPKALWDVEVSDVKDPTWAKTDISWSTNPKDWENARADLLNIIEK